MVVGSRPRPHHLPTAHKKPALDVLEGQPLRSTTECIGLLDGRCGDDSVAASFSSPGASLSEAGGDLKVAATEPNSLPAVSKTAEGEPSGLHGSQAYAFGGQASLALGGST